MSALETSNLPHHFLARVLAMRDDDRVRALAPSTVKCRCGRWTNWKAGGVCTRCRGVKRQEPCPRCGVPCKTKSGVCRGCQQAEKGAEK